MHEMQQSNTGAIVGGGNLETSQILPNQNIEVPQKRKHSSGEQAQIMSLLNSDEDADIIKGHYLVTNNNFCLNSITSGRAPHFKAKIKSAFSNLRKSNQ